MRLQGDVIFEAVPDEETCADLDLTLLGSMSATARSITKLITATTIAITVTMPCTATKSRAER